MVQKAFPKEQGALAGQNTALTLLWCHEMFLCWKALFRSLEGLDKKADKEDLLLLVWS